jgi:hypothetical protein
VRWLSTSMRWLSRSSSPSRRAKSTDDPVADALAKVAARGQPVSWRDDTSIAFEDLPGLFEVQDSGDIEGFNTVVSFDDEIGLSTDLEEDGLDEALAAQRGVGEVHQEDREVFYLRTELHLDDVRAAVIAAVVDVNFAPRPRKESLSGRAELDRAGASDLAEAVAPALEAVGFVLRPRSEAGLARYFDRSLDHGIQQQLIFSPAFGISAGVDTTGMAFMNARVQLPAGDTTSEAELQLWRMAGKWTLYDQTYVDPTREAVAASVDTRVLPWFTHTATRASVAAWASEDPTRINPPIDRPMVAKLLAGWGYKDEAHSILTYLDREWPSLKNERSAREAREILGEP